MIKTGKFKQIADGGLSKSIIEERNQMEEQHALFASIVNSSDDAIISKTLDGIITSWNHGAEKVLGYTEKEAVGKHVSILIPRFLRNEEKEIIKKIRKGEIVEHYETKRVRKDGKIILVSLTISPIRDLEGNITGASKIARDITKQKQTEEEVVNANKEKKTILNRISDGVVSIDNEWRYTFLNEAAMATHPLSKEETLGKVIWDVHPEMKGTIFWDKYHEAMRSRKPLEVEGHYEPMNMWLSVKVYPSADGLTIFYKNITESKKAERDLIKTFIANKELLYQNKEKEKRALELIVANKELIFQNAEEEKRAAELIIANKDLIFQSAEKEKRATELIIANAELVYQIEEKEKRAAELIIANKELVFQNDEKGKRAAELTETLERVSFLANIADNIQDPVISTNNPDDRNFIITRWNKPAEKLLEWTSEEVIGKDAIEIFQTAYPNENQEQIFAVLKTKEFWTGELIYHSKSGRPVQVLSTISNLKDAQGNITGNLFLIRDITLRKKVEEDLEAVNKELESFSYSISHDLRSPLRAINGFAKMLEDDYDKVFDNEGKRLLSVVQRNAKKMGVLIDDLLAFSRLGRKEIHKSRINMTALVESVYEELNKPTPSKAQLRIIDLEPVMADYSLMNQVWMNLLSNAIKYSSKTLNPVIEIRSEKRNNEMLYSIADNGAGFDMQYSQKLFGVFQRLHDSEEFEGTGVGLALVHRIITKHGGKIWGTGEVGKGATFYFSLPAGQPNLPS